MAKTLKFSNGDMIKDRNRGRPLEVTGTEKAAQDIAYFLMTAYDPARKVGGKLKNFDTAFQNISSLPEAVRLTIQREIQDIIARLQSWQNQDGTLTDAERIRGINSLVVLTDKRGGVLFQFSAQTATEDQIPSAFKIKLAHQYTGEVLPNLPGSADDRRA